MQQQQQQQQTFKMFSSAFYEYVPSLSQLSTAQSNFFKIDRSKSPLGRLHQNEAVDEMMMMMMMMMMIDSPECCSFRQVSPIQ